MELEKLVMTELEDMDLNDIKIIDLLCDADAAIISFERYDRKIDFVIERMGAIQVIAMTYDDQLYTDEVSLCPSNEWFKDVEYVWDVVNPIIEKYQSKLSEIAEKTSSDCTSNKNSQYVELFMDIKKMKQEIEELKRLVPQLVAQPEPASRKQKVLSAAYNIAFYFILVTAVLGVALFGLQEPGAPPRSLFGHAVMTVLSRSMEPTIPHRSLVILREVDVNTLKVGDVVTYLTPNNRTITHRIIEIIENYQGRGMRGFRLQGDNNLQEDFEVIWAENVIGEIIYSNLFLGQAVFFIQEYIALIVLFIGSFAALIFVIKKFFLDQDNLPAMQPAIDTELDVDGWGKKWRLSKDHIMSLMIVVVALVFSYSIYKMVIIGETYRTIETMNANLRSDYTQILENFEEDVEREFLTIDWEGLHERNEDVVAWVHVLGTNINYPILAGETNEEYLSLDIDRQHSIAGSIFLEENNESTFLDLNTIIYGHNMANGSKFSDVYGFVTGEITVEAAPYVYLYLPDGTVNIYKIVSAKLIDIYSEIYRLPVIDFEGFNELMLEGNVLNVLFNKDEQSRVLTLSTCAEIGVNSPIRSVVFAVLVEELSIY